MKGLLDILGPIAGFILLGAVVFGIAAPDSVTQPYTSNPAYNTSGAPTDDGTLAVIGLGFVVILALGLGMKSLVRMDLGKIGGIALLIVLVCLFLWASSLVQ